MLENRQTDVILCFLASSYGLWYIHGFLADSRSINLDNSLAFHFDITGLDSVLELKVGESVCITGKHARILASLSNLFRSVLYDNLDST